MNITIEAPTSTLLLVSIACGEIGISPSIVDGKARFTWTPGKDRALELSIGPAKVVLDTTEKGEPRLGMPSIFGSFLQVGLGLGAATMEKGWASWILKKGNRHASQIMPGVRVDLEV